MTRTKRKPTECQSLTTSSLQSEVDRRLFRALRQVKIRNQYGLFEFEVREERTPNAAQDIPINAKKDKRIRSLKKVEQNIFKGKYKKKPWRFIKEASLAFEAFLATVPNKKTVRYKAVEKLKEMFDCQMDIVMEEDGYCCGRWYIQYRRAVVCTAARDCVVPVDSFYYRYQDATFCQQHFIEGPGDRIDHEGELLLKSLFVQYYFNDSREERFAKCFICKKKFHSVCVFYCFSSVPFACPRCCELGNIIKRAPRASDLPSTECDEHIDKYLKKYQINQDNSIIIRLLSDKEEVFVLKEKLASQNQMPTEVPYRNCTLFTFFDTGENTHICFFSVFFQLHGSNGTEANRMSAYISYIDSVNLMPSKDRTKIYRLILLGLFDFLSSKGYSRVYLWSCPPKKNQDYIFAMKPENMKMPTSARLMKWYQELLELGSQLMVVKSNVGIDEYAVSNGWENLSCLPLMEGDLWITRATEAVTEADKQVLKLTNAMNKLKVDKEKVRDTEKHKELETQLKLMSGNLANFSSDRKIWEYLKVQLKGFNSHYFVIQLGADSKIDDKTLFQTNLGASEHWLNDRHLFVDFFCGDMLEFSSLRRAQYSTHVMLNRIFLENKLCIECKLKSESLSGALQCQDCHTKIYGPPPPELPMEELAVLSIEEQAELPMEEPAELPTEEPVLSLTCKELMEPDVASPKMSEDSKMLVDMQDVKRIYSTGGSLLGYGEMTEDEDHLERSQGFEDQAHVSGSPERLEDNSQTSTSSNESGFASTSPGSVSHTYEEEIPKQLVKTGPCNSTDFIEIIDSDDSEETDDSRLNNVPKRKKYRKSTQQSTPKRFHVGRLKMERDKESFFSGSKLPWQYNRTSKLELGYDRNLPVVVVVDSD